MRGVWVFSNLGMPTAERGSLRVERGRLRCGVGNQWTNVGGLLAGTNRAGQAAVVDPVSGVPQRLTEFDAFPQNFDFFGTASRCVGGRKSAFFVRDKIFIVSVSQDGFENVLAMTHIGSLPILGGRRQLRGVDGWLIGQLKLSTCCPMEAGVARMFD